MKLNTLLPEGGRWLRASVVLVMVTPWIPVDALAGTTIVFEEQELAASDPQRLDFFGTGIAIQGDVLAIGASGVDTSFENTGAVYVFQWNGTLWTQIQKLTAAAGDRYDLLGESIDIDGAAIVAGARRDSTEEPSIPGSAYVFRFDGSMWTEESRLTASDGELQDGFAESVGISGDTIVIGAIDDQDNGFSAGSAYVFGRSEGSWVEVTKLLATDGGEFDYFGADVCIEGSTIAIGAPGACAVYVFELEGNNWVERARLVASDAQITDQFGASVAMCDDRMVVGAYQDDDGGSSSGSAYVFRRVGGIWTEEAKLVASDADAGDRFGNTVSIAQSTIAIGATFDDDLGMSSGSAYVFEMVGGAWIETAKLLASNGEAGDWLGADEQVAVDQGRIVAGASRSDNSGAFSGAAYAFSAPIAQMPADLNGDGIVNGIDLAMLLSAWGDCPVGAAASCVADMNRDGSVDGVDLSQLLGSWTF